METSNIVDLGSRDGISDGLADLLRTGAQQLIAAAVDAELESFLEQYRSTRTKTGHGTIVRNGHHPARRLQAGIGLVSVRIPKVRFKTGRPVRF
jgi:putative transposase